MFREVRLPEEINGQLFLYRMPGTAHDLESELKLVADHGIGRIICLPTLDEIERRSPEYALAIARGKVPARVIRLPVEDFNVPEDGVKFARVARETADAVRAGGSVLVHCAAGIGRTGMFATLTLYYLGLDLDQALERVREAGSNPEAARQLEFIRSVIAPDRDGDD